MSLVAIQGAVVLGAFALARAWVRKRAPDRPRLATSIGVAVGVVVLAAAVAIPTAVASAMASSEIDRKPWGRVLKIRYPEAYRRAVASLAANGGDAGLEETVGALMLNLRPTFDAASARSLIQRSYDTARLIQDGDPQGCVAFLDSGTVPASFEKVVTPALKDREDALLATVLEQAAVRPAPPAPPLSPDQVVELYRQAVLALPDDQRQRGLEQLAAPPGPLTDAEARTGCALRLALYGELLRDDPRVSGERIRSFWATP